MHLNLIRLQEAYENNEGYCTVCEEFTMEDGVEPDASGYECPDCGQYTVIGTEFLAYEINAWEK